MPYKNIMKIQDTNNADFVIGEEIKNYLTASWWAPMIRIRNYFKQVIALIYFKIHLRNKLINLFVHVIIIIKGFVKKLV